ELMTNPDSFFCPRSDRMIVQRIIRALHGLSGHESSSLRSFHKIRLKRETGISQFLGERVSVFRLYRVKAWYSPCHPLSPLIPPQDLCCKEDGNMIPLQHSARGRSKETIKRWVEMLTSIRVTCPRCGWERTYMGTKLALIETS